MKPLNQTHETARRRSEIETLDQEIGRLTDVRAIEATVREKLTTWRR
jgi:hypothetical protein